MSLAGAVARLALAGLVLAGCGLPADGQPRELAADRVPPGLLAPGSTTLPPGNPAGDTAAELFFVDENRERLVAVPRELPSGTVRARLEALIAGVTEDDGPVFTDIASGTGLVDVQESAEGVVIITLTEDFLTIEGAPLRRAFAQLVYTATTVEGVSGVRFVVGGEEIVVLTDDANVSERPVGRGDFFSMRPEPTEEAEPADDQAPTGG